MNDQFMKRTPDRPKPPVLVYVPEFNYELNSPYANANSTFHNPFLRYDNLCYFGPLSFSISFLVEPAKER